MLAEQRKIHAAELLPGGRLFPSGFHKISRRKEIERLSLLDGIRGGAIISMILYHACWDAVNIGGVQWPWFNGVYAYLWQQSICCSFIFLSGFCSTLSRTVVRRGLIIFLCGGIVTLATALGISPGENYFWDPYPVGFMYACDAAV